MISIDGSRREEGICSERLEKKYPSKVGYEGKPISVRVYGGGCQAPK